MKKIAIIFVTASILGFLVEVIFVYIASGGYFRASGNIGWYYQFYGFCALFLYFAYTKLKVSYIKFFILCAIFAGVVEFSASYFLSHVLNFPAWSYCDEITNIYCRTTVLRNVAMAILGTTYVYLIVPFFLKLGEDKFFAYTCYIVMVFILLDSIFQLVKEVMILL